MSPGGAGGKGVWGRSGEVYEPEAVDERDPNYDEDQVIVVLTSPGLLLLLLLTQALLQMLKKRIHVPQTSVTEVRFCFVRKTVCMRRWSPRWMKGTSRRLLPP